MSSVDPEKLSALPALYAALVASTPVALTKGRLPRKDCLYIFYEDGEAILTGSPPHLDEVRLLAPSFRAGFKVRMSNVPPEGPLETALKSRKADNFPSKRIEPIQAQWLHVENGELRMMLEVYVAQKLGLTLTHQKIRDALGKASVKAALADISEPELTPL